MSDLRKIIHIDMDAFYASVEQRDFPELRGKAIAVGGGEKRGVTTTASYEARKFGVRSAMPGWQAIKLCPELIFVKPRFEVYREVSRQIRTIFFEYTDLVEPMALDEAYLDVTVNKKNMAIATDIAKEIRQKIFDVTQLTASAGVSYNKFLAKMASGVQKPNGLTVIKPHQAAAFIENLAIEKFYGVGKVTASKMQGFGIHKGSDLLQWSKADLVSLFGKAGTYYYDIARGIDHRTVEPDRPRKSYAVERTMDENLTELNDIHDYIDGIVDKLHRGLEKSQYFGKTLTLKFRNRDFVTRTRAVSRPYVIQTADELRALAHQLVNDNASLMTDVRLLGLTISNAPETEEGPTGQMRLPSKNLHSSTSVDIKNFIVSFLFPF
ncbi:MAG: DNA polymerase IV [Saprospiraceae bacterium]|nr:DNA polymerase IV [Saprospiraceae bacterium]